MSDDPLEQARFAYVRAIAVMDPLRFSFWDSRGVTMTQLRVMHLILQKCEPSTGELAEELHIRPATLTGLADRLEQKGFIRRWPDTNDRRVVRVGLTDDGSELLARAFAEGRAFLDSILERMSPEALDEFTRAVENFVAAAEASTPPEPVVAQVEPPDEE